MSSVNFARSWRALLLLLLLPVCYSRSEIIIIIIISTFASSLWSPLFAPLQLRVVFHFSTVAPSLFLSPLLPDTRDFSSSSSSSPPPGLISSSPHPFSPFSYFHVRLVRLSCLVIETLISLVAPSASFTRGRAARISFGGQSLLFLVS